jgi:hypothetical protein
VNPEQLWAFLPVGYLITVAIETPVLLVGLSPRHPIHRRFLAGLWLTACTYPIVILVLPLLLAPLPFWLYLTVAETFAPVAECTLFWVAFPPEKADGRVPWRDLLVITLANLASFGIGEWLHRQGWLDDLVYRIFG